MVVSSLGSFATYRAVTTRGPLLSVVVPSAAPPSLAETEWHRSLSGAGTPLPDTSRSSARAAFWIPIPTVFAPQRSSPRALWLCDEDNIAWRETDRKDRSDLHRGSDLATAVLSAGSPRTARLPHSQ